MLARDKCVRHTYIGTWQFWQGQKYSIKPILSSLATSTQFGSHSSLLHTSYIHVIAISRGMGINLPATSSAVWRYTGKILLWLVFHATKALSELLMASVTTVLKVSSHNCDATGCKLPCTGRIYAVPAYHYQGLGLLSIFPLEHVQRWSNKSHSERRSYHTH